MGAYYDTKKEKWIAVKNLRNIKIEKFPEYRFFIHRCADRYIRVFGVIEESSGGLVCKGSSKDDAERRANEILKGTKKNYFRRIIQDARKKSRRPL